MTDDDFFAYGSEFWQESFFLSLGKGADLLSTNHRTSIDLLVYCSLISEFLLYCKCRNWSINKWSFPFSFFSSSSSFDLGGKANKSTENSHKERDSLWKKSQNKEKRNRAFDRSFILSVTSTGIQIRKESFYCTPELSFHFKGTKINKFLLV